MGLPDWSRPKILLVMLAVTVPILVLIVMSKSDEPETSQQQEVSADCQRVDQAVRHWSDALPGIMHGLSGNAVASDVARDAAAAAASVRNDAASITDMSLRDKVTALADRLDMVSRGTPRAPDGFPDKNYMGGYQGMTPLVQQLKVACPNIGNDPLPAGFPSPPTK